MEDNVLKITIEAFIKAYVQDAKNIFEDVYLRGKQFLNRDIKKYLEKHLTKYSYIKTLLHGNTPKHLYEIYYHLKLFQTKSTFKQTLSVSNIFPPNINWLTIIGEAGSGKSTLIKHFFI